MKKDRRTLLKVLGGTTAAGAFARSAAFTSIPEIDLSRPGWDFPGAVRGSSLTNQIGVTTEAGEIHASGKNASA